MNASANLNFRRFSRLYFMAAMGLFANVFNLSPLAVNGLFNLSWGLLYIFTVPFIFTLFFSGMAARCWMIVLFCSYLLISTTWSTLPAQTLLNGAAIVMNLGFALVCAHKLSPRDFLQDLRWSINAMILLSFVVVVAGVPSGYYPDGLERQNIVGLTPLQGVFSHKNFFGFYAALGVGLNAFAISFLGRVMLIICIAAVLLSGSSTAILALIVVIMALTLMWIASKGLLQILIFPIAGAAAGALILAPQLYATLLDLLGRDASLTGRTDLWQWALWFFEKSPWIGWGYTGIFGDGPQAPGRLVTLPSGYDAPHFHNGYLQVLAETGAVGAAALSVIVLDAFGRAWRIGRGGRPDLESLFLPLIVTIALISIGMNILLRYNDISTMIIAYLFCVPRPALVPAALRPMGFLLPIEVLEDDLGSIEGANSGTRAGPVQSGYIQRP